MNPWPTYLAANARANRAYDSRMAELEGRAGVKTDAAIAKAVRKAADQKRYRAKKKAAP